MDATITFEKCSRCGRGFFPGSRNRKVDRQGRITHEHCPKAYARTTTDNVDRRLAQPCVFCQNSATWVLPCNNVQIHTCDSCAGNQLIGGQATVALSPVMASRMSNAFS